MMTPFFKFVVSSKDAFWSVNTQRIGMKLREGSRPKIIKANKYIASVFK